MTRFYLKSQTDNTTGLPTAEQSTLNSNKNAEAQTINRVMNTTIGNSQVNLPINTNPVTSTQNYYFTRFVSPSLNLTSVSANTWTYGFSARQDAESSGIANFPVSGNNQPVRVNCYVWRPGTGKIGTIRDGNTASTVDEGTGSQKSHVVTFAGSAVSGMQSGDRIVFEVWFVINQSFQARSWNNSFYYNGTTVPTENASQSSVASYIETPQDLTIQEGGTIPVGNTMSHIYNIDGVSTEALVGNSMMHRYRILPQQPSAPEHITAEGFTVFMRVYIPFIHNEALYNKRGVLFSKVDDEQVTHAYIAQVGDDGSLYWIVKDNSREYYLSAPNALSIIAAGLPDFADSDFNSQDFFTLTSIVGDLPNPIFYDDLAFTYSFVDHRMQIIDNGIVLADTANNPESSTGEESVTGLIGRWRMFEGSGTTINDSSPNEIHGELFNGTWNGDGTLTFDNLDTYVSIPTTSGGLNTLTTNFSFACWAYITAGEGPYAGLVSNLNGKLNINRLLVNPVSASSTTILWQAHNGTGAVNTSISGQPGVLDGWHHFAVTYDGSNVRLYLDGALILTDPQTYSMDSGTENMKLGWGSTSIYHLTGMMTNARVWNRRISNDEVSTLFQNGFRYVGQQGLVGHWRLNEGGDIGNDPLEPSTFTRTAYNSVSSGNNGTINNAIWTTIPGLPHETYLNFDGDNDNVQISNYTAIQNLSEFTVSFWYYPKAIPPTDGFIIQKNGGSTSNRWLIYHQTTGFVRFSLWNDSSTRFDITFNSAFPTLNTWYHIVAKVTLGSTGKIFVNNVKVTGGSNVTGTINTGATNVWFGGGSVNNTPTGIIHDVKLWNRELSDAEIETLFDNGHPVSGFPPWKEDPPLPPDQPVPITNPFTEIYNLPNPFDATWEWQTLHELFTSGFTQVYQNVDGILVPEVNEPFSTVYNVTGSGGGGGGGGGPTQTVYNVPVNTGAGHHLEFENGINRGGVRFNPGNSHIGKVVKSVTVRFRRQGGSSGTVSVVVRNTNGTHKTNLGTFSLGSFSSGGTEHSHTINASSNSYSMQSNDVVSVEYPSSSSGIELSYGSSAPSGFTSVRASGGSFSTFNNNGNTIIAMKIDVSGSAGGGGGGGVAMFGSVTNNVGGARVCKAHVNSTNANIYNKKITRVKLFLSKVGFPSGTLQVQLRSSNTNAVVNMGSRNVSTQIGSTPSEHIFTFTNNGLEGGFALPNGGGVAVAYTGGNLDNYVVVNTSGSSEVPNVHVRNHEYNNVEFPFGSFVWKDYTSQDVTGTFETGGYIVPAKQPWFALDGGAIRAVGQRPINANGVLAGKKVTRFKPKLKAIGNPTGTIRCVIRTSAGTEVGHLGSIEANTVGPTSFEEKEFTNILQNRTLVAGDMVLIEYAGTPQNHIQVMIEWDETHGGQLGNDQAMTFNGSSYTAIPADMSGTIFTGGSATDPTSRERVGVRVRSGQPNNSILHLKKLSKALVYLRKIGNPTGNVFLRIRRGSNDNTVANIGQIPVSSIDAAGYYEFTNTPVSIYAIQLNDRVLVEYKDGDDTNYIQVGITKTDQIDGTRSHLTKFDALWTDYDEITNADLIMIAHAGGDTFVPTGDEIPPAPPPQYSHDLHIFAGGYPYDYYEETSIVENWVSTISPDVRFYRKILTPQELSNIYGNRRDRANLPFTQIAVVGFFSLPP